MTQKKPFRSLLRRLWFTVIQIPERFVIARHCPYGDPAFFDLAALPMTAALEANWKAVRREVEGVLQHSETVPNFQDIVEEITVTDDDRWKTFFLYGFGHKVEANCARCPETTRLIEQVPGMMTAFFSILYPHKHIPEHRGPYKGFLRYHLGLIVPEPQSGCRIRVGDEVAYWEEGRSLLFDDTKPHEAWNETDGIRVVLFMDLIRPLPKVASLVNQAIIRLMSRSLQVRRARERQQQWAQQDWAEAEPVW